MSTVRLFILDSLVRHGPMHGHQMRALAEQEHVDEWTDITVGSLYGALKRLEAEGLVEAVRTEREGNYPPRRVLDVTDAGRAALDELHVSALAVVGLRPDPADYPLARPQPGHLDNLATVLKDRLAALHEQVAAHRAQLVAIDQHLTLAERLTLTHTTDRLNAEVEFHERLLAAVPEIVADELSRKDSHV